MIAKGCRVFRRHHAQSQSGRTIAPKPCVFQPARGDVALGLTAAAKGFLHRIVAFLDCGENIDVVGNAAKAIVAA
jgi:hypothetical protein